MGKAVVVLSGGQDSTTCLFWALETFEEVHAVIFDYNQRNIEEVKAAKEIADYAGVTSKVIKLDFDGFAPNAMTDTAMEIEEGEEGEVPNTFVPGRNHLFLSYASIYARKIGAHHVITGVSQTDYSGYPDCTNEFIKSFGKTISIAMDYDIYILAPLMYLDKSQVWDLAEKIGGTELVDFIKKNTVSCYNGIKGNGCAECPSCKLRNRGYNKYLRGKRQ